MYNLSRYLTHKQLEIEELIMAKVRRYNGNYILDIDTEKIREYNGSYLYQLDGNKLRRYNGSYI